MKILKLKLRGSIGIKKGLGVDEVEIDFSQFEPGLIALTGKNGSGKTTVMENLHPYRTMVSRTGSLQSHFFLKDSFRILTFENDGLIYNSEIYIDALTGGSEAYLFQMIFDSSSEDGLRRKPMNDGKLTTYDEALENLLGSQELFFNSVFSGQKSKGIAELKPADRRKLFYELLNLNVYDQYLEKAKSELKQHEIKLAEIEGQISSIDANPETLKGLENSRISALNNIANTEIKITKVEEEIGKLNTSIKDLSLQAAKLEEKEKSNSELQYTQRELTIKLAQLIDSKEKKQLVFASDLEDTELLISHNKKLLEKKDEIESAIKKREETEKKITDLNSKKTQKVMDWNDKASEFGKENQRLVELNNKIIEFDKYRDQSAREVETIKDGIKRNKATSGLIDSVPCDESIGGTCQFLTNAYASKNAIPELEESLKIAKEKLETRTDEVVKMTEEYNLAKERHDNEYKTAVYNHNTEMEGIDSELKTLQYLLNDSGKNLSSQKADLQEAETNVKVLTEKLENIKSRMAESEENSQQLIEQTEKEIKTVESKIDAGIYEKIEQINGRIQLEETEVEQKQSSLVQLNDQITYQKGVLSDCEAQLAQMKKNEQKLQELNVKKVCVQSEIKDWTFLAKAFDKTGIPVLKLENSGFEITTIANDLLSLFQNKFRIVFETTKLKSNKKEYKESFDINIVEEDGVCEISNKSGGQQVWLETAIQSAISLVVRQQGRNIQTSFLDEKDGALDLANAYSYIEMIQKAHQMSGVHNTFVITHRTELLDFIPQQIKLADGVLSVLN